MSRISGKQNQNNPQISVIIPTTCEDSRSESLLRAISSIREQEGVLVEILLICNGNRQDGQLLAYLERQDGLRILRIQEGNVSKARYLGVCNVNSEFFCFLDDDDEFLPGCLQQRLAVMTNDLDCEVVVTNGFYHILGTDIPMVSSDLALMINSDVCGTFLQQNWFSSPASMFRTQRIKAELFDFAYRYFEWTYLFFRIVSLKKKLVFDNVITYRKYEDNPLAVSKSIEYALAYPDFLIEVKRLKLPKDVKGAIQKKYVTALNSQSNIYRERGQLINAWKFHLACLMHGGWQYISYTRRLLFPFYK